MWLYEDEEFNPSPADMQWEGFVYEIYDTANGMKYIGKKNFWSVRRLKPLKGKTRRRVQKKESDWRKYHGSNEKIMKLVEENDTTRWRRTILRLCRSKGEMSYFETKLQFEKNVLFDPNYYNEFIGLKLHSKHVAHLSEEMLNDRPGSKASQPVDVGSEGTSDPE